MTKDDKVKQIIDLLTKKRREISAELQARYKQKHELEKELFDRSIPYSRHKEAKEMLDITVDLISDLALELSVWDQAREIAFNVQGEDA